MEETVTIKPMGDNFDIEVPTRILSAYQAGYEPMSKSIFSSSSLGCDVILDIGAHVGYYSLVAGESNPNAKIISIEASPDNFQVLQRNVKKIKNQRRTQAILGVFGKTLENRKVHLTDASDNCGLTGHPNSPTNRHVMVNGITVSSLEIESNTKVLAKVDVEGHEIEVVEELLRLTDLSCELRLLIEFNPKTLIHAGNQPARLVEVLLRNNYRIFIIDEDERDFQEVIGEDDNCLKRVGKSYRNIYCLPKKSCTYIASFLHSNFIGGAEKSHVEVCEDLISSGNMIKTFLPRSLMGIHSRLELVGSSIEDCPLLSNWWASDFSNSSEKSFLNHLLPFSAVSWIREKVWSHFDCCLTQTSVTALGALVAIFSGKPHFWWVREFGDLDHNLRYPFSIRDMGNVIRDLSQQVIANSNAVKGHFFGKDPKVIVIEPTPSTIKMPSGRKPKVPHISLVGSLNPGKGADVFLRALSHLKEEGLIFSASLRGAGSYEREQTLMDLITSLELENTVDIRKGLTSQEDIYSDVSIVVIASRHEAYGRVPFEGTGYNCAIVYSRSGGLLEYMDEGFSGLAFDPEDHLELAKNLTKLIENPALAQKLILCAKESLLSEKRYEQSKKKLSRIF